METTSIMMEGGEWTSFDKVSINEEADFMANLFSNSSFSNDPEMSSLSLTSSIYSGQSHEHNNNAMFGGENTSFYTTDSDSNLYSLSHQGTSLSGSSESVAYQCHENYCLSDTNEFFGINGSSLPFEFCLDTKGVVQVFPVNPIERNHSLNLEMSCDNLDESEMGLNQPGNLFVNSKHEISEIEPAEEGKCIDSSEVGRKRPRNSEVQKGKRNMRSKKSRKMISDNDDISPALKNQNTGSCSSEDELSGENTKAPTKTRASRGSATDPQSLYARKRRERINERLRILQSIVPNGTKVDLSTMLEEAVNYVKFLQLQIKLLSSDDLWMYAPLAYNGMDIGLDAKLNSLL